MAKTSYLVGIVGGSASGKSSFLRDLLGRLPAKQCAVVSQDNYYRDIGEQLRDAAGQPNFDLPTAIRHELFADDLQKLLHGEQIAKVEYTFNHRDKPGRTIVVEPAPVILVEGLFLFHFEDIRTLFDLRVFIDTREDVCKQRRLQRDAAERGYPAEYVEYQWENHVLPAYRQFVLPYRDVAHVIVTNHDGYDKGLEVVAHHIMAVIGD